jgi:hypothetical protein
MQFVHNIKPPPRVKCCPNFVCKNNQIKIKRDLVLTCNLH